MSLHKHLVLRIVIALTVVIGASSYASAEETDLHVPRNVLHVEASTLFVCGGVSVNYERLLTSFLSLRGGYGLSGVFTDYVSAYAHGPQAMVLEFFGPSKGKFEIGAGATVMHVTPMDPVATETAAWRVSPAVSLGIRFQPTFGGLFGRAGWMWSHGYGIGMGFSLGRAF